MTLGLFLLDLHWLPLVYSEQERARLDTSVEWVAEPQSAVTIRDHRSILQHVEVIFAGWGTAVMNEAFLQAAPSLRAVFHAGGSVRYFTPPAFWASGVVLATASAVNALPVAEYTLAALLFGLRGGWYYGRGARQDGRFPPPIEAPGGYGSTVGLISLGAVGRLVAERLRPYDLKVIAHDPFADPAEADALGIELVSLSELFRRADAVSVHAPLLPATAGMIRGEHLAALKPGALLINTARGALINEPEMIDVLKRRPDLHAVLDVTDPEPPLPGSALFSLPNVVLTPHIAGTSGRECERLGRAMVEDYFRWRQKLPLRHQVRPNQAELQA